MAQQDLGGQGLLFIKAAWSCLNTPHLERLHCTHDQPITDIYTWKHTTLTSNIHALHSICTCNPNKQQPTDPCLRPHSQRTATKCPLSPRYVPFLWNTNLRCPKRSILYLGSLYLLQFKCHLPDKFATIHSVWNCFTCNLVKTEKRKTKNLPKEQQLSLI